MYTSKLDRNVFAMFPELSKKDLTTYSVIRWDERIHILKDRSNVKRSDYHLEHIHLTEAEAEAMVKDSFDGSHNEVEKISTMFLFRAFYLSEVKRLDRANRITQLRKIVRLGLSAKILFKRKFSEYQYDADTFIKDYAY